ncbi:hypothetical protein AGDE_02907 [Angomonas deanei]|nr:hypothetical protein AGDE_06807 [Angomonas deanei]EPY41018.1 hypothetical protein AGDE_02907 [Angomonas deanei]|eukprot:EPY36659.1 hypothetical protein AGDE_06807 [Angomonas deanei]
MAEKVKLDKKTFLYDYDQDKRFQVWKEDRKKAEERLHIHWIDNVIDRPLTAMVYFLRVFTTVGLFYGLGRTAYLYRTMDRTYAKLNGVSIGKILFEEVSFNVAKGGGVAAVSALSIPLGDSTSKMIRTAYRGEVYAPQREWYDVVSSFTMGGFAAGGTFAAIERQVFSPRGMLFLIGGGTLAGLAAGFFLGYSVYRPVAEKRKTEGGLYERPWKNWSNLYVASGGPAYMRGKYTWSHGGREEP